MKKWIAITGITLLSVLIIIGVVFGLIFHTRLMDIESAIRSIYIPSTQTLDYGSLVSDLKTMLDDQNSPFAGHEVTLKPNAQNATMDIVMSATPKQYEEGMTAIFYLGEQQAEMTYKGNAFVGSVNVPIGDKAYENPSVALTLNGVTTSDVFDDVIDARDYFTDAYKFSAYSTSYGLKDEDSVQPNSNGGQAVCDYVLSDFSCASDASPVVSARIFAMMNGEELWTHDFNAADPASWSYQFDYDADDNLRPKDATDDNPYILYLEIKNQDGFAYRWRLSSPWPDSGGYAGNDCEIYAQNGTRISLPDDAYSDMNYDYPVPVN